MASPPRLTLLKMVILRIRGFVRLREEWGGSGFVDVYMFKCPVHGIVESRAHGWEGELRCPFCFSELLEETEIVSPSFV